MADNEIVMTGMGVVTPNATSVPEFWQANLNGTSGLRRETRMDLSQLPCGWVAGILPEESRAEVMARWGAPGRSWADTLLHSVVDQALRDAKVDGPLERPAGLVWARVWPSGSGGTPDQYAAHIAELGERYDATQGSAAENLRRIREHGTSSELADLSTFPTEVSERLGTPLIAARVEATCAGGLRAIAEASRLLQLGKVDLVVVAACVSRHTQYILSQYGQLMALSRWKGAPEQASMPFDRRRTGMVINESAGALVLETAEHAARRGVTQAYAGIAGWGLAVDTTHITAPRVEAVERVMRTALATSGIAPEAIDVVNAHGTSTRLNDITEARALHRVFGDQMAELDVCAVKSITGHGSAASGVVESAIAGLTLCAGIVPPVVTCTEPDPECGVKTSLEPVHRPVHRVLKNSFGFGGQYASMVFHRPLHPRSVPASR